jgi:hypothetical protein
MKNEVFSFLVHFKIHFAIKETKRIKIRNGTKQNVILMKFII